MKKINLLLILSISFFVFFSCEKNEDVIAVSEIDYVSFQIDSDQGIDVTEVTPIEVKVYSSSITTSDRTINFAVDATLTTLTTAAYTVPTSVIIPANSNEGTYVVSVNGPEVGSGGVLVMDFIADNNIAFTGDALTLNIFPACFDNTPNLTLTLEIVFDDWPEEIYWIIQDSDDNVVAESAPNSYGAYSGLTGGISQDFCLSDGEYSFTIYDAYGDGAGSYSLMFSDGNVVHSSDGAYGGGETISFSLGD